MMTYPRGEERSFATAELRQLARLWKRPAIHRTTLLRCGSRYLSRVQQPFDTTPTLMARETKVSRIIDSMGGDKSPSLRSFELSDKARRHRQRAASTPKEMFVVTQSAQAGRQISDTQSRRAALDPGSSRNAERPSIRQGIPVNWAAWEGNRCRPIHDGAPALGCSCKVHGRRRMDAGSAL